MFRSEPAGSATEAKLIALNKKLKASQTALFTATERVTALEATVARTQTLLAEEKSLTGRLRDGLKKFDVQTLELQQRVTSEKTRADREMVRAEQALQAVMQLQVDCEELSQRIRNHVCGVVAPVASTATTTVSTQHSNPPTSRPASRPGTPHRTGTSEHASLPAVPQPPPWTPPYTLPGTRSGRSVVVLVLVVIAVFDFFFFSKCVSHPHVHVNLNVPIATTLVWFRSNTSVLVMTIVSHCLRQPRECTAVLILRVPPRMHT
jgi:hypothetical protein